MKHLYKIWLVMWAAALVAAYYWQGNLGIYILPLALGFIPALFLQELH